MKSLLGLIAGLVLLNSVEVKAHDNYQTLLRFISSNKIVIKFPFKNQHQNFPSFLAQLQVSKKGIKIPIIEAKEGDVLAFDGERWVPTDLTDVIGEGLVGPMGPAGAQGLKGDKGDIGPIGPQGIIGTQGAKGDTGAQGATGVAGAKGDKGETGAQGAGGVAGVKGETGAQGAAGVAGAKGDKGETGAQGADGVAGAKGDKGETGAQGADGIAGAKGDRGDTGAIGPQGLMGLMGLDGLPGSKGDKGDVGAMGPQGLMGLMGLDGLPGVKGDKGDTGEMGPMGIQGLTGLKGEKGDKGDAGRDANLYAGTNPGDMVQLDQNGKIPASVLPVVTPPSSNISEVAYIRDQRTSGLDGGTCFEGIWQKRVLNVHTGSTSFISLANNEFTLTPGEYRIEGRAPAFQTASHKAIIVLVSTGLPVIVGSSARSHASSASVTDSFFSDTLIVNTTSSFEVRHMCTKTYEDFGLGVSSRFPGIPEVYTQLKIEKVK